MSEDDVLFGYRLRVLTTVAPSARPQHEAETALAGAGYAAPHEPPREPQPERHVEAEGPGELVGMDCFYVGRLQGTKGAGWQLTAIDPPGSVGGSIRWRPPLVCCLS